MLPRCWEHEKPGVDGGGGHEGGLMVQDASDEGVQQVVRAMEYQGLMGVDDGGKGKVCNAQVADLP